ncbi:MAG: lysine transporter LysE [Sphingobacteriales bacterium]|nr:MAG: lysine transporter LysE [Sphingobacteriales bacterium]
MLAMLQLFFTGLFISFLGALPLGSLNIAAMQVAVQENTQKAIYFSLGVALVEVLYVRLSLKGMHWVAANQQLFHILEWATVFLFIVLAISSFATARKTSGPKKNILLNNNMHRFWLGFTMSAINPVQIPFWFLWSTYLLSNKILQTTNSSYNWYTAGIGCGTLCGLALFIYGGKWLVNRLKTSHATINYIVALVFIISAALQLYRVWYKPFSSQLPATTTHSPKQ